MSEDILYSSADELIEALSQKKVSSRELAEAFLRRTRSVEPQVHAFLHYDEDDFLQQADAADQRLANGEQRGPLEGIPVALKDILAQSGQRLTCASRMLEAFESPYDATAVEKLRDAGALLWGRLNMDEFAMGSSTENSAFGRTSNPWSLDCIPGGSSGGSAASVAARETPFALGTDTGGSIRQPAAFCGVVGMKPSYGLVSRYGLVAFASSLDQIGPFAHTVKDAAILLQAIAGYDAKDSTSYRTPIPDYRQALEHSHERKWRIGIPKEYFEYELDADVERALQQSIDYYRQTGSEIVELSLPHTDLAVPVYYIIAPAEASSNLARYDGVRYTHRSAEATDLQELYSKSRAEGFGSEVKRRIILGTYVLSSGYYDAYYLRAQKVRTLIRNDFQQAFEHCDALLTPTTPTPAFPAGERADDPLAMYLCDIFTIAANLAGLPALSIPCGFTNKELPIGMQLIGKPFAESQLLEMAHHYDREHQFGVRSPSGLQK